MMRCAVIALVLLAACSHGYRWMEQQVDAEQRRYNEARDYINDLHDRPCHEGDLAPCRVTADVWRRWVEIRGEVLKADSAFFAAMIQYRDTGVRPPGFDRLRANLRRTQSWMIALANEVGGRRK